MPYIKAYIKGLGLTCLAKRGEGAGGGGGGRVFVSLRVVCLLHGCLEQVIIT